VLVLKDELTHHCELVAAEAVLDWHKRFGLPAEWVSDNGSHFKAALLQELAACVHARQRFVPVFIGTVELVNRDILGA
jgi:hypothetical protein